jgi:hypothetical protein
VWVSEKIIKINNIIDCNDKIILKHKLNVGESMTFKCRQSKCEVNLTFNAKTSYMIGI